jgi:hypothetical protein
MQVSLQWCAATIVGVVAPGLILGPARAVESQIKHYRYVRWESTGQNEFILAGKQAVSIRIDGSKAPQKYKALYSLDTCVLSPNQDGNIVLVGYLDPTRRSPLTSDKYQGAADPPGSIYYRLVLHDWYVAAPFQRELPRTAEQRIEQPPTYARTSTLRRRDFNTAFARSLKLDWRSLSFRPSHYVRRLRLRPITHGDYHLALSGVPASTLRSAGWNP